jgi:HAD superfamily hydrolase (TIGR01509 family)
VTWGAANGLLAILDLGSTLVEGPSRGPARRIAELAGLDEVTKRSVHRQLMTADYACADEAAAAVRDRLERAAAAAGGTAGQAAQSAAAVGAAVERAVVQVWQAQEHEARPLPLVGEVMAELVARGWRLALLSNIWVPYLRSVRSLFGDFFDRHIPGGLQVFSCREGLAKPEPELFRRVLQRAGTTAADAVMIGDSYRKDVQPAAALGLRTVWLLHDPPREVRALLEILNGRLPPPTLTLRSLADLDPAGLDVAGPDPAGPDLVGRGGLDPGRGGRPRRAQEEQEEECASSRSNASPPASC